MNTKAITDKSIDEMIELMKTADFSNLVENDATVAFITEYSKILLDNYHTELTKTLKSKGIEI